MTPQQCRAARELLNWRQVALAEKAGVDIMTISGFECGKRRLLPTSMASMRAAFDAAGVTFIDDDKVEGVTVQKSDQPPGNAA